jgi:multicomponent Na+:H+ antiporter subunit F
MNLHDYLYYIILPVLTLGVILVFFRFFKGPTISDRVVALDLLITIGIGIIAMYSIISNQPTFLDIAMILALIAFLSTTAFSYYLEKRRKNND